MWRWADVKMSRCERRSEDEQMWRWAGVREDVKMSRCERRCEDEQMWEKIWRWEGVKMRRCEDEQMWRWEDVKMSRCEDEKVWRWEDVKMRRCDRRCEDEKVWRWEGVKMRRWDTDPHYWKNPALRRSREKAPQQHSRQTLLLLGVQACRLAGLKGAKALQGLDSSFLGGSSLPFGSLQGCTSSAAAQHSRHTATLFFSWGFNSAVWFA